MRRQILLAAGLIGLAAPLAAQQEAPPAQQGAAPPSAGQPAAPAADPQVERQRTNAAKLAGMIRFVAASCPEAQPDYERFKGVIAAMRVDIKDLENGPLMATSLGYSQAYQKEPEKSCARAFQHFGESGTTIPGLIARKPPGQAGQDGEQPPAASPTPPIDAAPPASAPPTPAR